MLKDSSNQKTGIHNILNISFFYNFVESVLGGKKATNLFIRNYVVPIQGENVLDFGAGTCVLFEELQKIKNLSYTAIEPNQRYVENSKRRYGSHSNANFYIGSTEVLNQLRNDFDKIIVCAVLHHINIELWPQILHNLANKLRDGGKIILLDPVIHEKQNWIARFLISIDRGKSIVDVDKYIKVLSECGYSTNSTLRTDLLRVPYSHLITTLKKS
jgi:2-polyprenyl-3-methyl-5-hydroxy-6-metoxy-1,4-benzoquinol methylase